MKNRHRGLTVRRWPVIGLLLLAFAGACRPNDPSPRAVRAAGGVPVYSAAARAMAVVVGKIDRVTRIDLHGYRAHLGVERNLHGPYAAGARVQIAWEELSEERAVRFSNGDRLLVVLDPLPSASLWLNRFPPPLRDGKVAVVAGRYEAFYLDPRPHDVDLLAAYMALPEAERHRPAGVQALANAVADAAVPLAAGALGELEQVDAIALGNGLAADAMARALADTRPDDLRRRVLALIRKHGLTALRASIERLAQPGSRLEADALSVVAGLDGGLPDARVEALLRRPDAEVRVVAVRSLHGSDGTSQLSLIARHDSSPRVRAAAVERLLEIAGSAAIDDAIPALSDSDASVRGTAATALGRLGGEAVARLKQTAARGSGDEAKAAVLGLSAAGADGATALREIATETSDPQVRQLAELALGRAGEHH